MAISSKETTYSTLLSWGEFAYRAYHLPLGSRRMQEAEEAWQTLSLSERRQAAFRWGTAWKRSCEKQNLHPSHG
ncbi:MAG: hypothetical protein MK135_05200, partial [Polyangiaceae bacterium]|nr:hypothetical protein [Polyangiaceae bacterium]